VDGTKLARAEAECQSARSVFESLDAALKQDIPMLAEAADILLEAGISAALRLQSLVAAEAADSLAFIPGDEADFSSLEQAMGQIRSLQIANP
jgi:hypothetical protein